MIWGRSVGLHVIDVGGYHGSRQLVRDVRNLPIQWLDAQAVELTACGLSLGESHCLADRVGSLFVAEVNDILDCGEAPLYQVGITRRHTFF
jgi:hypothetical protein